MTAAALEQYRTDAVSVAALEGTVLPVDSSGLFSGFSAATAIDLSKADTASVTNMSDMFRNCWVLTDLEITGFDTTRVKDLSGMFSRCASLRTIDVSRFDTSGAEKLDGMFACCTSLESLDLSRFNTEKVTSMRYLFGCDAAYGLFASQEAYLAYQVEMEQYETTEEAAAALLEKHAEEGLTPEQTELLFHGCESLRSLDLSSFDLTALLAENEYGMTGIFANCTGLEELTFGEKFGTIRDIMMLKIDPVTRWGRPDENGWELCKTAAYAEAGAVFNSAEITSPGTYTKVRYAAKWEHLAALAADGGMVIIGNAINALPEDAPITLTKQTVLELNGSSVTGGFILDVDCPPVEVMHPGDKTRLTVSVSDHDSAPGRTVISGDVTDEMLASGFEDCRLLITAGDEKPVVTVKGILSAKNVILSDDDTFVYILPSIAKHNNVVLCRLRSSRQSHYVALAEGV